jgi:hypothetical protein
MLAAGPGGDLSGARLDTSMASERLNDPGGAATVRIARESSPVPVSVVVAAELRFGAAKRRSAVTSSPATKPSIASPVGGSKTGRAEDRASG